MNSEEIKGFGDKWVMNTYSRLPLAPVRGAGSRVWDAEGKEYLDFVGGLGVNALGHCHPQVVDSLARQARKLMHCSNLYWIEPQVRLARVLGELSGLARVFFCNSGAEANEGAIKLARKYTQVRRGEKRYRIITMEKSFHGRTLGALAATGQEKFHYGFAPLPPGFTHVPFNDLDALEKAIDRETCAVMLEPIQGEGGVYPARKDYLHGVRELCDYHELLLIMDEVQCGLGRTGSLFAFEHYEVKPDIMTLAKALGGGLPIGALLAGEEVAHGFQPGDHAATFGGNPLVCSVALTVMEVLQEGILDQVRENGDYFWKRLLALKEKHSSIKEIRGQGLLLGLELASSVAPEIRQSCQQKGLLVNSIGEKILRFLPPLIVSKKEIDEAVSILEEGISASF